MEARPREGNGRGGTILLVEDSDVVRDVVANMLESGGLTVLQASGGEEALALSRRGDAPIDLLLTDIVM
ncbi:MAG: response regulator, partial [Candidatus Deferrimicrobium sp.]|nr:response regulator [Candidatus Deferrimicrobium sp.]